MITLAAFKAATQDAKESHGGRVTAVTAELLAGLRRKSRLRRTCGARSLGPRGPHISPAVGAAARQAYLHPDGLV